MRGVQINKLQWFWKAWLLKSKGIIRDKQLQKHELKAQEYKNWFKLCKPFIFYIKFLLKTTAVHGAPKDL